MDLYISSVLLGVLGLAAMALSGLGHGHGAGSHSHAGHGHTGHTGHAGHAHGHGARTGSSAGNSQGSSQGHSSFLWNIMSPRFLFSVALGFGAAGLMIKPFFNDAIVLPALALLGGVIFERAIVSPLWNLSMKFASNPASTLESAVSDEATAVTSFDANGQGIVSLEVDGQIVQILATLQPNDRLLGVRVRAGQRVRIEDVNAAASCCTVSLI